MAKRKFKGAAWCRRPVVNGDVQPAPSDWPLLAIGPYPQRERLALYINQGGHSHPLAYFRGDRETQERYAAELIRLLDDWLNAREFPGPDSRPTGHGSV
jgi:hypothetical protein